MRDPDRFVMGLRHRRPWSRAGRVVLIEDITRSNRPRLETYRPPPGRDNLLALIAICLSGVAFVSIVCAVARVVW